jgi:hypothetical protein
LRKGSADHLIKKIAMNAIADDPFVDKTAPIRPSQLMYAAMFDIEITQKKPALIKGQCLIQQSGDALAQSDPLAALGCHMALMGAAAFSSTLDVGLQQGYRNYSFAAGKQARHLVHQSFRARGDHLESANVEYLLQCCVEKGWITDEELEHFDREVCVKLLSHQEKFREFALGAKKLLMKLQARKANH